jgi:hypothetical protein
MSELNAAPRSPFTGDCLACPTRALYRSHFRQTAVQNLERAGVPRQAVMAMVGHRSDSIYRRQPLADETMLKDGAAKLAALHELDKRV